jgi:REP element-mobilizing transposase RayT
MPSGLKRYQQAGDVHFITFSCHRREPLLGSPSARRVFEMTLERVRVWYGFCVMGYVVMPEHVHLLVSEPDRSKLAVALQMLKQVSAHELRQFTQDQAFWIARYDITTSTSGLSASGSRSYATYTVIRLSEDWSPIPKTGNGVAFDITSPAQKEL